MTAAPILIVPGRGGSGPGHWQTLWTEQFQARRVEHREWDAPVAAEWIETLDAAIANCPAPPVLVAHSVGCPLVAHWAAQHARPVRAELLVAPSDVESDAHTAKEAHAFRPLPMRPLPFPSILVASTDDPRCDIARAEQMAAAWGSAFRNVGAKGHINIAAGFGPWVEGEKILEGLMARMTAGS